MRTEDLFSAPHASVLEAPEENYAPAPRRRSRQPEPASRRDFGDDFASTLPDTSGQFDDDPAPRRRNSSYRLRLNGRALQVPKSTWGRVLSVIAFLIFLGVCAAVLVAVRSFFLHDPRFTIASSSEIQTTGNTHLSRAQLLSVFGEDVERNIFNIPLAARRAELQSLPWVEHATVMRLLPNHIRIAITERTPVAFVRQRNQIGMVDASGVLLDMPADAPGNSNYSFPVVTGINASDPLSTRAARMRIYSAFIADLDSTGTPISRKFSEVDLSNPEDVKALIPEGNNDILVHFGDSDFLARYQKFQDHIQEWLTDHPNLASAGHALRAPGRARNAARRIHAPRHIRPAQSRRRTARREASAKARQQTRHYSYEAARANREARCKIREARCKGGKNGKDSRHKTRSYR